MEPNFKDKRHASFLSPQPYTPKHPPYLHEYTAEKAKAPKPITIDDLFPRIDRWGIGILETLQHLQDLSQEKPSYPPYNIKKFDGDVWRIDLAVAGFRKEEIEVIVEDRTLIVQSNYQETEEDVQLRKGEVIHQGIAQRNFELKFALSEYIEVVSAEMHDGILTVKMENQIPEEKKPKVIDIN